jgi:hypothetical protein
MKTKVFGEQKDIIVIETRDRDTIDILVANSIKGDIKA